MQLALTEPVFQFTIKQSPFRKERQKISSVDTSLTNQLKSDLQFECDCYAREKEIVKLIFAES